MKLIFLIVSRAVPVLGLSRRESWWKDAEIAAALFAIGLAIAALARTAGAARGLMAAALYPMMFFSGLYYPVQLMPAVIQDISELHPARRGRPGDRPLVGGPVPARAAAAGPRGIRASVRIPRQAPLQVGMA